MKTPMHFEIQERNGVTSVDMTAQCLVVAGWAGRDVGAIEHHIRELEAIGVPRPSAVPLYYRVAADQLTQAADVEVVGGNTSGEVEPFVFVDAGELFVGVGSDHTDRTLETHSVALSKQICAKPVGRTAWRFSDVRDHWDEIVLRSWITDEAGEHLYQEGAAGSLRSPEELVRSYLGDAPLPQGLCMSCGTVPVIGGIRPAASMRIELFDERLGRRIDHCYAVRVLPEVA